MSQRGARWSFFDHVGDVGRGQTKDPVGVDRWRLFRCPWFGIFLHKITKPDSARHLHNHPWWFMPIILKGGYDERWQQGIGFATRVRSWRRGSWRTMHRREFHGIASLVRVPTWTLIIVGPGYNDDQGMPEWGFLVDGKVVPWYVYDRSDYIQD
jgi:hypothetical protein